MKTSQSQIFMELLSRSIGEALNTGDIALTTNVMNDPVLLMRIENSPVCFCIGWDSQENHSVFSLN